MIFSRSLIHVTEARNISLASWWSLVARQPLTREEHEELTQALKTAHEDFVTWASSLPWRSSNADMHSLRHLLSRTNGVGLRIHLMSDHEVARAIFEDLQQGKLIFVPPPWDVKWYIEETRTQRNRVHKRADPPIPNQVLAKAALTRADLPALLNPVAPSPVADFMANEVGEDIDRLVRKSPGSETRNRG